ncbi:MAG: metal-dependent hydrolase [Thiotrichales bacterium]|nr:metal-dependent hydrolase [Thiotrichales bacterium]
MKMLAGSHLVFGSGLYLLASPALGMDFPQVYAYLPLVLLGALAPDVDARRSRLKRWLWLRALLWPLTLLGHRTWTHSLWILLLLSSPLLSLPPGLGYHALLAFSFGYGSHILADWMTHRGVPLFYPLKTAFKSPLSFRTGSWLELPVAMIPFGFMAGLYLSDTPFDLLQWLILFLEEAV